jgi:peptide/nickel transport system permease protein
MARAIPGDPCHSMLGERATQEVCDQFIMDRGLDKPIPIQFLFYLRDVAQGDLGVSLQFGRPVTEILGERLPLHQEEFQV